MRLENDGRCSEEDAGACVQGIIPVTTETRPMNLKFEVHERRGGLVAQAYQVLPTSEFGLSA